MMFKNTIKLLSANFYSFWKMFLYKIIVVAITVGLCFAVSHQLVEAFSMAGFGTSLLNFLSNFSIVPNLMQVIVEIYELMVVFFNSILNLFTLDLFAGVYFIFVIFFGYPFLNKLADIPFGECVYGYMASLTKYSFPVAYIRMFLKSICYAFSSTLLDLVLSSAILLGCYGIFTFMNYSYVTQLIIPILLCGFAVFAFALKQTFTSGWVPTVVVYADGVIKDFGKGLRVVGRRFFKTLSNLIVINTIFAVLSYLLSIYSLVILYPLYTLFIIIFQFVMFFGSNGMRYYVDMDTILTPQKLETFDKYKKIKNLI